MVMVPLLPTVIVRCQVLKPAFSITTACSPGVSFKVEGVLPINFPSTVMSAPSGVALMTTVDKSDRPAVTSIAWVWVAGAALLATV